MSNVACRRASRTDSRPRVFTWLAMALVCASAAACDWSSTEPLAEGSASRPAPRSDAPIGQPSADPFWDGLARESIQLDQTLLVVKGSKGIAGCTYLNVDTFERAGEPCVIIPAADFDGMLDAKVTAATSQAQALGINPGMSGREALDRLR